jgi:hypothetical protein
LTLSDYKGDTLTFGKFTIAIALDLGMMDKYIGRTFTLDKSKALLGIEPFHSTSDTFFRHWGDSFPTKRVWCRGNGAAWGIKKPSALIQVRWELISSSANNLFHYKNDYTPVFINRPIYVL